MNILLDPVWSKAVGPFGRLGPHRIHPPGIQFEHLPKIDFVLVTHSHYDHLDLPTLTRLHKKDQPQVITGLNMERHLGFLKKGGRLHTLDWWQAFQTPCLTVHYCPAFHWSKRTLRDQNRCLWGGFFIESPHWKLYFAGDTGFAQGKPFVEISHAFPHIDIAFLPIGCYQPRWFMKKAHMNPAEAVQAHQILKPRLFSIPFHFGTFNLADESYEAPLKDLQQAPYNQRLPEKAFHVLQPGEFLRHHGSRRARHPLKP